MKRALLALLVGAMVMSATTAMAWDQTNEISAIALHVTPWEPPLPGLCGLTGVTGPTVQVTGDLTGDPINDDWFIVYLLVCNASDSLGVAGLQYGIDYNVGIQAGVDVHTWVSCTDLEFSSTGFPAAGGGNLQTWNYVSNCQDVLSEPYVPHTVIAVAGFFEVQVWNPDIMVVTPRPVDGAAKVGDCFGAEWDITGAVPSQLGFVGFGLAGWNPCSAPTPTQKSTWGQIKQQY